MKKAIGIVLFLSCVWSVRGQNEMAATASFVKRAENNFVRSRLENVGPDGNIRYEKMLAVIDGFDSRYEGTTADDVVTFRCVAGNEVRMLRTDDALQGKARSLAELCRRIVREIDVYEANKEEYVRTIETF